MNSIQSSAGLLESRGIKVLRGGFPVIDIPKLLVEHGRVISLIGPNGSGKSTLMLALASLLKLHQGSIFFHGQPIDSSAARAAYRKKLAMVFQEPLLFGGKRGHPILLPSSKKLKNKNNRIFNAINSSPDFRRTTAFSSV